MSIEHMVWIKFKEGVSDERKSEHMAMVMTLKDSVPGVIQLRAGENFTERAKGFTHGVLVTFDSREGLDNYLQHPEHLAVSRPLFADADVMVMDFEYD